MSTQTEFWCLDCHELAYPGDVRCAIHSWNRDALDAYRGIKLELAKDADLGTAFDEGQA